MLFSWVGRQSRVGDDGEDDEGSDDSDSDDGDAGCDDENNESGKRGDAGSNDGNGIGDGEYADGRYSEHGDVMHSVMCRVAEAVT